MFILIKELTILNRYIILKDKKQKHITKIQKHKKKEKKENYGTFCSSTGYSRRGRYS